MSRYSVVKIFSRNAATVTLSVIVFLVAIYKGLADQLNGCEAPALADVPLDDQVRCLQ
ncbi:hypothetical protein FMEAI12_2560005 [Parafrankia sp. Ea1.12]|nr:hypothetical protein FMEAI12_2560005 [Parafrankia sp. Ea1.12]